MLFIPQRYSAGIQLNGEAKAKEVFAIRTVTAAEKSSIRHAENMRRLQSLAHRIIYSISDILSLRIIFGGSDTKDYVLLHRISG